MSKSRWLLIINPLLLLLILAQVVTGMAADHLPEQVFQHVHFGGGSLLLVLGVAHLLLNWGWVKTNYFKRKAKTAVKTPVNR